LTPALSNTRTRAERLMDERLKIQERHENVIAEANNRADSNFTESENDLLKGYRERTAAIDGELEIVNDDLEREEKSEETSKLVRGHLAGHASGVQMDGDAVVYRTFSAYARDRLVRDVEQIQRKVEREISPQAVQDARERLMRAPAHTLTSDIGGLLPPQHISQIMDVINAARPVVESGNRVDLSTGTLTWPKITQRPIVAKQGTEKTTVSDQKMIVTMENDTADTYLGVGNLSWQAINWSTPSALDLYFRLMAEAYAEQTEAAACGVLADAAATIMSGALAGSSSDTFEDWITAVVAGVSQVFDATRRIPNTIWLAPDMFFLAAALTTDSGTPFISAGNLDLSALNGRLAGLRVITSAGFDTGQAIVGDSAALLVGETAGAPVELRAVEPAIGGLEVGIIGAFKAISFDDDRFADIGPTT
jgi:HK97 family phage major capsid protein